MIKNIRFLLSFLALLLCFNMVALGQETTGEIEGSIKDPQGAVVPGVPVTVRSGAGTSGFIRTVTTDDNGTFRVQRVPPGIYTVSTEAASGFGASTNNNVEVVLGKTTPVSITLQAGGGVTTVDVTAGDIAIDTTDSKIQTNITTQAIELLPKGTNFTSLLQTAPAVRNEPASGGFQIDGASGAENTFIIDGQEVSNFRTGVLNSNNNIPFQFVQEVQIKSSGFEAQFGGATGGVITVVTKGGSNEFRGEVGTSFEPSELQAGPRQFLRLVAATSAPNPVRPVRAEYLRPSRDGGTNFFPSATLGGPILKDRIWFFGSYAPQYFNTTRTLNYISPEPNGRTLLAAETYRQRIKREYAFGRIDIQPTNTIRLTGSYTWNPIIQEGSPDAFTNTTSTVPAITFPGTGLRRGAAYLDLVGGRVNSNNTAGSVVWTPTSRLVLTARGGYSFLNEKNGNYGVPSVTGQTRLVVQSSSLTPAPTNFGLAVGQQNFPGFSQLLFDSSRRRTFDGDAAYTLDGFVGRHQFKGGYQFNGIGNVVQSTLVDTVVFRFGRTISNVAGRPATELPSSPTAIGAGFLQRFGIFGNAGSDNQAFYIQDSWQPITRLTINFGVRAEKENSPSFAAGAPGITFNYGDKIAPRFGFALDLFGDGKTKIFGSYGRFFDRFKYELPRGSFGGNFFRNDYFEIFPGQTIANFNRGTIIAGRPDPIGGTCPIANANPSAAPFTRCQLDFRIPSNLPGNTLDLGAVDPDLQAFRQSEYTVGVERDMGKGYLLSGRYTHKQVDVAVEDIGFLTSTLGEAYIIGNPGRGLARQQSVANGAIPLEAVRDYDALEVRLNKRFASNIYFDGSYTYSRLFGNYAGLASSDEVTGGVGRQSPNVNRNFDLPFIGFSALGKPDNGRLPTDRPHAFKLSGAYTYKWSSTNNTEFSLFTLAQSGTPRTTRFTLYGVAGQILNGRGDLGRTEAFTQSDFGVRHKYRFGNDGRFTLSVDLDILNLFNEANVLGHFDDISTTSINLDSSDLNIAANEAIGINIFQRQALNTRINNFLRATGEFANNPNYPGLTSTVDPRFLQPNLYQNPRSVRFGFRLLF